MSRDIEYYRVVRKDYTFAHGELVEMNEMLIGAVIADSPMEALDIALHWFPLRPRQLINCRRCKNAIETASAKILVHNRIREHREFEKLMERIMGESVDDCKGA